MSWVKDRDVWFEGQVADDFFDSLEGDWIWSCIVTGEAGDSIHDIVSCIVAKVKKGTNEGSVGSFVD